MDRKAKGNRGEELAKATYIKNGFEIMFSNYRYKRSEIDFVASDGDLLVFVEVKLRSSEVFGYPESFVTQSQEDRIREAAEEFILEKDWKKDIRFDVCSVGPDGQVEIFQDAF